MNDSLFPSLNLAGALNKAYYFKTAEADYGAQRANSRTHKRYLRQHHLGKFKKKHKFKKKQAK